MSGERSSYLALLPAVYQRGVEAQLAAGAPAFLTDFLAIFEKILSGVDDGALDGRKGLAELIAPGVLGELFYPRFSFLFPGDPKFMPPLGPQELDEFNRYVGIAGAPDEVGTVFTAWLRGLLVWLAGWMGLELDGNWSLDKQRTVIASMLPLYRARGTREGLQALFDLVVELVTGYRVEVQDATGAPALQVGQNVVLRASYVAGDPLVGGARPWFFRVVLYLPTWKTAGQSFAIADVRAAVAQIRLWVDRLKPEGSRYELALCPTLQLGNAILGVDSLLGCYPCGEETPA